MKDKIPPLPDDFPRVSRPDLEYWLQVQQERREALERGFPKMWNEAIKARSQETGRRPACNKCGTYLTNLTKGLIIGDQLLCAACKKKYREIYGMTAGTGL